MDVDKLYRAITEAGNDHADKAAAAALLEGSMKTLLASLTLAAKSEKNCSVAEANLHALTHPDYKKAREDMIEARRAEHRAKVRCTALDARFQAQRTLEASHRAAMHAAK